MQISENDSSAEVIASFVFDPVENLVFEDKKINELIKKWGLINVSINSYRFNQRFEEAGAESFILELFNFPAVRSTFKKLNVPSENFSQVKYKRLKTQEIKMDMFDKINSNSNVVVNDLIKQTYEDQCGDITINDILREVLIKEESEHYELFTEDNRKELLFRIFQLFVLGGQMCQWEERFSVYLESTKFLYKNLVTARKDPQTENIFIDSFAYEITSLDKSYKKSDNPQDVVYVIVNPSIRVVHILFNNWTKVW